MALARDPPAPATQEDFRRGVWSGPLGLPSYLEEEGLPPMLLSRGSGSKFLAVPKIYLSQVEAKATLRHIHPEPSLLSSSGLSPLLWPFVREAQKPVGPGGQLSRSGQGSAGRPKPSRARAAAWAQQTPSPL